MTISKQRLAATAVHNKTSRTAISGSQKEEICNYARTHPQASNTMILAWARARFRPNFPQSTLSTVLSKNGIITRKSGSRGRPPSRNTLVRLENNTIKQDRRPSDLQFDKDSGYPIVSSRTGILIKDLLTLVGDRCRERLSVYRNVEIQLLEDIYNVLRLAQSRITYEYIRERTFQLLLQTRPNYQRKYLCQFLDCLSAKYFLINVVVQHLRPPAGVEYPMTYQQMLDKLGTKFPGLRFSAVPEMLTPVSPLNMDITSSVVTPEDSDYEYTHTHIPINDHDEVFSQLSTYCTNVSEFSLPDSGNLINSQDIILCPDESSNFLSSPDLNSSLVDLCNINQMDLWQYYDIKQETQIYEF